MPAAPGDLTVDRRGNTIDVQFVVPSANTDGTRPANVASAEIYALTAPAAGAPTIVVYSSAPASSRAPRTEAMVEPFWPMAT